jgi:ABC-type uncharacterized transport system permease subunit
MNAIAMAALVPYLLGAFLARPPADGRDEGGSAWWWAGAAAVAGHVLFHALVWRQLHGVDLHFHAALSLVGVAMALVVIAAARAAETRLLARIVFPIAAAVLLLYALAGDRTASPGAQAWQITLHAAFALLAFASLSIAALVAIIVFIQERALRAHRPASVLSAFPPLATMERLLFQLIGAGFALLSATLLTGVVFVEDLFAQHLAHKTVLSIAAWLVFGMLLAGRWRWGWRGRRAVRFTLAGMGLLLLAFVGTKFVLEIVLQRTA